MNYKRKITSALKSGLINSILSLLLITYSGYCIGQAQDFNSPKSRPNSTKGGFNFDPDRMVIGGNLGANFGTVTLIEIAPSVGYLLTDNYLVGINGRYIYFEDRRLAPSFIYKSNIYGGGIFNQYFILESIILHAEYELLNIENNITSLRTNISSVFVGGGYRSNLGGNSYFSVLLLYNLNDSVESPYTNPILRFGFGIGL